MAEEDTEPNPLAGKFNLSATNTLFGDGEFGGDGLFSFTAIGPGEVEVGEAVEVPLTYVTALPGALDAAYSGIKFLWTPDHPGSATLYLLGATEQTIFGQLKAHLFTEREYSPPGRRMEIELTANFIAQRGQLACQ